MSETSNNKRIAKNALFMYFRMFLTMGVGLYTARVVLKTLGVDDFGIYNVVGGVVVLFTFISNSMASATQRHLSYELGKQDGDISRIYSACMNVHVWIALLVVLFAETIGLWFLNAKLNIPTDRVTAANWVYQFSVISCFLGIIRVPDNAAVISYERMSFFAYMGIAEAVMKLLVVYVLLVVDTDKLSLYAALLTVVTTITNIAFWAYRKKHLTEIHYDYHKGKGLYRGLLSFSGWTLFGSIANMGRSQGVNIIINLFYGVSLNAAVGIANQVNSHVGALVGGFQQALNPQLVKSQASKDKEMQFKLICRSARFSFFLMLLLAYPIMMNLAYILGLWLGEYPEHTVAICNIIVIGGMIEAIAGPLWVTLYATGHIKTYQITVSIVLLLILPISYIGGKMGMSSEMMFIYTDILLFINNIVRLWFLKRYIDFDVIRFTKDVFVRIAIAITLLVIPLIIIPTNIIISTTFIQFITVSSILFIYESTIIVCFGITASERNKLLSFTINKIKKM